jgi:soluble lytic murein transglycosylase
MKKKGKKQGRWLIPVLLIVIAAWFVQTESMPRWAYPISYQAEIKRNADEYQVDPLLIAAIIKVESNYKIDAVSPKGAVGIMQLMPKTAEWILQKQRFGDISVDQVGSEANAGIALGSWYVRELMRQFDGELAATIAAYNAGPGKVRQWLDEGTWDGSLQNVRRIPYGETRHYVQRVIFYYQKYLKLYETL